MKNGCFPQRRTATSELLKYVQRTDYDKVCALLKEIGCKFTRNETMESGNILTIEIDSESIISFGGVAIDFYDDGSFKGFIACE